MPQSWSCRQTPSASPASGQSLFPPKTPGKLQLSLSSFPEKYFWFHFRATLWQVTLNPAPLSHHHPLPQPHQTMPPALLSHLLMTRWALHSTCSQSGLDIFFFQVLNAFGPDPGEIGISSQGRRKSPRDSGHTHRGGPSTSRPSRPCSSATSHPNPKRHGPTQGQSQTQSQKKSQDLRSNNDFYYVGEFYG